MSKHPIPRASRFRFYVPGGVVIAVAAIIGAIVVWPSDLAWALFALAVLATLSLWDFWMEFDGD